MTQTITLGGRDFEVRALKLSQLRGLLDALDGMTGKSAGALIDAAAKVVTAGLAPAHPDLAADTVLDFEATIEELNAAVAAILRTAGLTPRENNMGEARPVASRPEAPGPSSAPSMAPSPPAVDTTTAPSTI
jgi:hypothetical protein